MKLVLLTLALLLLTANQAHAQQVAAPCVTVPGTGGAPASCQPVTSTNPLPVTSN